MIPSDLKDFLDEKVARSKTLEFINIDPIQIPHLFSNKYDFALFRLGVFESF